MKRNMGVFLSYLLVAILSTVTTMGLLWYEGVLDYSKLDQLEDLIEERFIGEADPVKLEDAAAEAMIKATGDKWSYYISAEEYAEYEERMANAYVGVGITIQIREDKNGFTITKVEPGGSAQAGGVLPGDILIGAEGERFVNVDL